MSTYIGGKGIFPGSFNPPHFAHMRTIRQALECFDVLHMFVRYNEGVDLVDWETKRGWFDRINEEMDHRLVIHKMENQAVRGKSYTMEDFYEFIRDTIREVGEPVAGFVFGDDYKNLIPLFRQEFPQLYFFKGPPPADGEVRLSSSAIREDLEGHKNWLPAYVYETLYERRERGLFGEAHTAPESAEGAIGPADKAQSADKTQQADGIRQADKAPQGDETDPCEKVDLTSRPVLGSGFGSTVYGFDEKTIVRREGVLL